MKIRKIFGSNIESKGYKELLFTPTSNENHIKGLIMTNDLEVSLSFNNDTELIFNKYNQDSSIDISPNQKVIRLDEQLNGVIKGIVRNISNEQIRSSIYLIIK